MKSTRSTKKLVTSQVNAGGASKLANVASKVGQFAQESSKTSMRRRESRYDPGIAGLDAGDVDIDESLLQPKLLLKPADQLELTEKELKEEFTRMLTANNPRAPSNPVRFSFKEQAFKPISQMDNLAVHIHLDSSMLHKESDEAVRQLARDGLTVSSEIDVTAAANTDSESAEAEKTDEVEGGKSEDASSTGGRKLMNQFNFSERAAQTLNQPMRDRSTMTEPPPRLEYSGLVNQWTIHDSYLEDLEKQNTTKQAKIKSASSKLQSKEEAKTRGMTAMEVIAFNELQNVSTSLSILERMVNQNTYDEISQDFKYWEDAGDEYRDGKGSLLPLWKFSYEKAKKFSVTCLKWNHHFKDMVAVAYGSYNFMNDIGGIMCFYTLKNPTFPEYIFNTQSGITCIDFNQDDYSLIAVGFYSGNVAVYDLNLFKDENPIYKSSALNGKHSDPVWQVSWQKPNPDDYSNFYSLSTDGFIKVWTIVKNELQFDEVIRLRVEECSFVGPDGVETEILGCGTCFDFSPFSDNLFLVATEEGCVHKCSKFYINQYLETVQAHTMAIYSLKMNPFHQNIFLTCSADWSVKIWDHSRLSAGPLFTYDLNNTVTDAVWAPYASTIFAACTVDGHVYVYDLHYNKYSPLCKQQILQGKKAKLTKLSFNPHSPILIVSDDRGTIFTFKISPNLRKVEKEKNFSAENEIAKLEKLISFVLEPLLVNQHKQEQ